MMVMVTVIVMVMVVVMVMVMVMVMVHRYQDGTRPDRAQYSYKFARC